MSKFDTHGGYFSPKDYLRVNEGGSHEENPNGGVQLGVDPEGNPNLLEEGEPVYKDYVYSDNIEADEKFLVDNNLPKKYAGKLYSKIADDFVSEAEERPLDPISRNGLEVMLGRLAEAQEGQKQAKEQADLEAELANLSPEELDELEMMLAQGQGPVGTDNPAYGPSPVGAEGPEGIVSEQMPMMACGGKVNKMEDGGPKKKGDDLADEILADIVSSGRASGIGNTDYPLIGEHPEMDLALMAAQPGGIVAKALAPSAYRSLINDAATGNIGLEAMSPAAKTKIVEQAMDEAYKVGKAASTIGSSRAKDVLKKAGRIAGDVVFPEFGIPREVWKASSKFGKGFWPTVGRVGVTIPAVAAGAAIGAGETKVIGAMIDNKRNSKPVTYSDFDPAAPVAASADTTNIATGKYVEPFACGGKVNRYPEGGTLNPVYVTAKGPKNYGLWDLWLQAQANDGLRLSPHAIDLSIFNRYGSDDVESNETLNPAVVTANGPRGYEFNNMVVNTKPEGLRIVPHQLNPWPTYADEEESVAGTGSGASGATTSSLPTWPRYAGAIGSGLLGLYNVFQQPDKYVQPKINPVTPTGRIYMRNQVYNPIDQNMIMNAQIAQGNATNRALRNSGLGPSSAAAILAADNNTTGNLGTGFIQSWDANNQRRNAVIAANNQAEAQRAQFDANMDYYRTDALNKAAMYNAQNDLMTQRLNYAAEGDKYSAISNQIANGLQALSGIGQENFAMNQVNSNPAYLGYRVGPNGMMFYNPNTGKWEAVDTNKKS